MCYENYYEDTDFVCTKKNDKLIILNSIKCYTQKYRKESSVNFNFHFHSFRHTHVTMLLENGTKPKEMQNRLGHLNLATMMDTHADVTKKMKKETVDIFENILTLKSNEGFL